MRPTELQRILELTLSDGRLSRTEQKALRTVLADWGPSEESLARLRSDVFDAARGALGAHPPEAVLDWVEGVMKVVSPALESAPSEGTAQVFFSPGEACRRRLADLIAAARQRVDVCVFTVTDDLLSQALLDAHRRGVQVRLLTDDLKAEDRGSDVDALARAGLPVRTDRTDAHMHHKYALFDGGLLATGSYNWTRSAFLENHENILVTGDPRLVRPFSEAFERLWSGPDTGPHHPGG